jgi:hypothetical protein
MAEQGEELVTVFRSADDSAETDANAVRELLVEAGFSAEVFGDDTPGVVGGSFEVRVPPSEASRAEQFIAENQETVEESERINPSHEFDLVTIFSSQNVDAESEVIAIRGVLDANGIPSLLAGNIPYPNLPFEIKVAKEDVERAERAIAEARAAGPAAAEEAEEASEGSV